MKFEISASAKNNIGRLRGNNEDNFYMNGEFMQRNALDIGASMSAVCRDDMQLYLVCDGMGGTDAGEDASYYAVTEFVSLEKAYAELAEGNGLRNFLRRISDTIDSDSVKKQRRSGTTIALLLVCGDHVTVANVGDSRVYRFREGVLTQISLDHSKVQRLVTMGVLTKEQAKTAPDQHVITQFLGMPREVRISPHIVEHEELRDGDTWLLCSDGLTDMVSDEDIEEIMRGEADPDACAQQLLMTALANGGKDNVTVMIVRASRIEEKQEEDTGAAARAFLTVGQIAAGCACAASLADLVYYLMH